MLSVVELGQHHLAVTVDEGLLIDLSHVLEVAHVVGVLAAEVAGVLGLYFAVSLFLLSRPLQRSQLVLGQNQPFLGHLGRQCLEPLGKGLQVMAQPDGAHPAATDE